MNKGFLLLLVVCCSAIQITEASAFDLDQIIDQIIIERVNTFLKDNTTLVVGVILLIALCILSIMLSFTKLFVRAILVPYCLDGI